MKTYDFSGWATRNGLKCSDGRTIMKDAFIENDGKTVPLVWNHQHNDPNNVLGHALLENRDEGVYAYCSFNDTENGAVGKALVQHGDIVSLSIYANQLKQSGSNVMHGMIREVSLVHAGANPGAFIDAVVSHSDASDGEAVIYTGEDLELFHAEEEKKEEPKPEEKENKDMAETASKKTIGDVVDSMNEEQKKVLYALVGLALEEDNSDEGEDEDVKHNVFDNDYQSDDVLVHDAMNEIMLDARRTNGSLKESYLMHAAEYGIENIDFINTEEKDIYDRPQWINNEPSDWVAVTINGDHYTPFAKVRMQFADITADEARAKGYTKGKYKFEEVFKLLKRVVSPGWIYKKQKFDRQDIVDADFDIIPWVKSEMMTLLKDKMTPQEILDILYQDVKDNPNNPDAYYKFAYELHKANRLEDAITYYELAIKMNSKMADAYINLAQAYVQKGDNQKAIAVVKQGKSVISGHKKPAVLFA